MKMMKKINSIGYAHIIVRTALLFLIGIPVPLELLRRVIPCTLFLFLEKISIFIGLLVAIFLIVLLSIELRQDKVIDGIYQKNKNMRVLLRNGYYECQACGNRQIRFTHTHCPICGIKFILRSELKCKK